MMKCKLCQNNFDKLQNSHIIPEWVYKKIYDDKGRFPDIDIYNEKLDIEQKGFREFLLCWDCEQKFCKWENNLKKDLTDIGKESSKFLSINKSNNETTVNNIDYNTFKKAILSIIWRMSITKHNNFKSYSLGEKYEEDLRILLLNDNHIPDTNYPITIQKVLIKNTYYNEIIFLFDRPTKIGSKLIIQSFVIYGFLVDIGISDKKYPDDFFSKSLKETGNIIVKSIRYKDLNINSKLLKRLNDKDVKDFYKYN